MGTIWVQVASAPLGAGLTARFRAGRRWSPGELDDQVPVLVDDAVLAELEGDGMLRVRRLKPDEAADSKAFKKVGLPKSPEIVTLPSRLQVEAGASALDKAKAIKAENEALRAQLQLEELEEENAHLKKLVARKAAGEKRQAKEPEPKPEKGEGKPEGKKE